MYCSRPVARSPSVIRVVRPAAAKCPARNASFLSAQPFFNRFPGHVAASNDLTPFFRLFDDFTAPLVPQFRHHAASFQPRFDVREVEGSYELRGELPGIEGKDVEVVFSDPQTLVVRGKTQKETTSGTPPAATTEAEAEAEATPAETDATMTNAVETEAEASDAASTYSTGSYQKPSVEDEDSPAAQETATPAESTAEEKAPEPTTAVAEQPQEPKSRYWVSERVSGSFQRVFKFPAKVDTEGVKASLKNGILDIVVPKAAAPEAKRINVE